MVKVVLYDSPFDNNPLETIEVNSENKTYYSLDNCLITRNNKTLLKMAKKGIIPNDIEILGYKSLELYDKETYVFGNNIKLIDNKIFGETNSTIKKIILNEKCKTLSDSCFYMCENLNSINLENVEKIGERVFEGCKKLIAYNDKLFAHYGTNNTSTTSYIIPNGIEEICGSAFYDNYNLYSNLQLITIPSTVKKIGSSAFENCNQLTSISIPNSVEIINNVTFYECSSLTSITLPSDLKYIGDRAFSNCSNLSSINIPNSVMKIGFWAFAYCNYLSTCIIGSGIKYIGNDLVYKNSGNSVTLKIKAKNPPVLSGTLGKNSYISAIYVPVGSAALYKEATNWSQYESKIYEDPNL